MQDRKVQGVNIDKQEQRREKDIWQHRFKTWSCCSVSLTMGSGSKSLTRESGNTLKLWEHLQSEMSFPKLLYLQSPHFSALFCHWSQRGLGTESRKARTKRHTTIHCQKYHFQADGEYNTFIGMEYQPNHNGNASFTFMILKECEKRIHFYPTHS